MFFFPLCTFFFSHLNRNKPFFPSQANEQANVSPPIESASFANKLFIFYSLLNKLFFHHFLLNNIFFKQNLAPPRHISFGRLLKLCSGSTISSWHSALPVASWMCFPSATCCRQAGGVRLIWMSKNVLKLNGEKIRFLVIHPKWASTWSFPITVGGANIQPSQCAHNFGILSDQAMSLQQRTEVLCLSAYFQCHCTGRFQWYVDVDRIMKEHCSAHWFQTV